MLRQTLILIAIASALTACSGKTDSAGATANASTIIDKDKKPEATSKLKVAPEDVVTVQSNAMASGPVITGSVQPERNADLRAEVSALVLQVLKENGDVVKRGDILVKLDDTSIRDNLNSAEDNTKSAALALQQADRALQRLKTLRASGMASLQALDDAEVRRNNAESDLSASRARAVVARQQLQRTLIRAPFDGVVSERKVSAGDTAAIGKELVKVIDPTSMRFAGWVSAEKVAQVQVGASVNFRINGYAGQEFRGKVTRVNPAANDLTRQVEVLVSIADASQLRVAGLYGEGTIEASSSNVLMLPEAAIVRLGDQTFAWKVAGNSLAKVTIQTGKRDQRSGDMEIRSGLAAGDTVIRNPNSNFKDGQAIEMAGEKLTVAGTAHIQGK